jgi:hypothetical protein
MTILFYFKNKQIKIIYFWIIPLYSLSSIDDYILTISGN